MNEPRGHGKAGATPDGFLPFLLLLAIAAGAGGCRCRAIANHQWLGRRPPAVNRPEDIAANLRETVNEPINAFGRAAGVFQAPLKRAGVWGWSDLGYDAEIVGRVRQTAKSTDQFLTVDMELEQLRIDGRNLALTNERYLRAEVCLCDVTLTPDEWPREGEPVWMRGRIVWDGDGFMEIHPRSAAEVRRLPPAAKSETARR